MHPGRSLPLLLCAAVLCGCGNPGSPLPPSLMLPQPVTDLHAQRTADTVTLGWTMPSRSTDRVALKGDQRVAVCRAESNGPCAAIAVLLLAPGAPAAYTDALPPSLRTGPLRALRYQVRVENRRQAAVGASNPALAAAGPAPPAVRGAHGETTSRGIVVRWDAAAGSEPPEGERLLVRLTREQITGAPAAPPVTLESAEHWEPGAGRWAPDHTVDAAAPVPGTYRYRVELVAEAALGKQSVETVGTGADTPAIAARDVFPPAVPVGLEAVANPEGGSIDLSWNPGGDPDLAGYFVYRRTAGAAAAPERVSGKAPVSAPGWSDATAKPGVRYAYSVSSVDASGNESARSPEAIEALPAPENPRR